MHWEVGFSFGDLRPVHLAHSAGADGGDYLVGAESVTGCETHCFNPCVQLTTTVAGPVSASLSTGKRKRWPLAVTLNL